MCRIPVTPHLYGLSVIDCCKVLQSHSTTPEREHGGGIAADVVYKIYGACSFLTTSNARQPGVVLALSGCMRGLWLGREGLRPLKLLRRHLPS